MINLLDLSPWVAKLKNECPVFENRVFATIPDDSLSIELHQSPVVFVYVSDDSSEENQMGKGRDVIQRMSVQITVEVAIRRTPTRGDAFDELSVQAIKTYREAILNSLIGFKPAGYLRAVAHSSGKLNKKEPKLIKWADTFSTQTLIQGEQ